MANIMYIVDMQGDFMPFEGSALPVPGGDSTIAPINAKLAKLDPTETKLVIVSEDFHEADFVERMPDGTPFNPHCVRDTKGAQTVVDLSLVHKDIMVLVIRKNAFNVFEEASLDVIYWRSGLRMEMNRDELFAYIRDELGIVDVDLNGVCSDICVNFAGLGLLDRGFTVTVDRNCVKGLFREIDDVNENDWGGRATLV